MTILFSFSLNCKEYELHTKYQVNYYFLKDKNENNNLRLIILQNCFQNHLHFT